MAVPSLDVIMPDLEDIAQTELVERDRQAAALAKPRALGVV
jgi:hypothetical protein